MDSITSGAIVILTDGSQTPPMVLTDTELKDLLKEVILALAPTTVVVPILIPVQPVIKAI
jgi:hypothetical protein